MVIDIGPVENISIKELVDPLTIDPLPYPWKRERRRSLQPPTTKAAQQLLEQVKNEGGDY